MTTTTGLILAAFTLNNTINKNWFKPAWRIITPLYSSCRKVIILVCIYLTREEELQGYYLMANKDWRLV